MRGSCLYRPLLEKTKIWGVKLLLFSYKSVKTFVLGAQNYEMVLLPNFLALAVTWVKVFRIISELFKYILFVKSISLGVSS